MGKKDYILIAAELSNLFLSQKRTSKEKELYSSLIATLSSSLATTNSKFNSTKFWDACFPEIKNR